MPNFIPAELSHYTVHSNISYFWLSLYNIKVLKWNNYIVLMYAQTHECIFSTVVLHKSYLENIQDI